MKQITKSLANTILLLVFVFVFCTILIALAKSFLIQAENNIEFMNKTCKENGFNQFTDYNDHIFLRSFECNHKFIFKKHLNGSWVIVNES